MNKRKPDTSIAPIPADADNSDLFRVPPPADVGRPPSRQRDAQSALAPLADAVPDAGQAPPQAAAVAAVQSEIGNRQSAMPRPALPCLTEFPASCPRCKSISYGKNKNTEKTREFPDRPIRLPDGTTHIGIRLQRRKCTQCGRAFNVRMPLVS